MKRAAASLMGQRRTGFSSAWLAVKLPIRYATRVQRKQPSEPMLWPHQHAKLSRLAAGSLSQGPEADPQSVRRSWFEPRVAKSGLFPNIRCLVVRSGTS